MHPSSRHSGHNTFKPDLRYFLPDLVSCKEYGAMGDWSWSHADTPLSWKRGVRHRAGWNSKWEVASWQKMQRWSLNPVSCRISNKQETNSAFTHRSLACIWSIVNIWKASKGIQASCFILRKPSVRGCPHSVVRLGRHDWSAASNVVSPLNDQY